MTSYCNKKIRLISNRNHNHSHSHNHSHLVQSHKYHRNIITSFRFNSGRDGRIRINTIKLKKVDNVHYLNDLINCNYNVIAKINTNCNYVELELKSAKIIGENSICIEYCSNNNNCSPFISCGNFYNGVITICV